jgi:hypothetical protein
MFKVMDLECFISSFILPICLHCTASAPTSLYHLVPPHCTAFLYCIPAGDVARKYIKDPELLKFIDLECFIWSTVNADMTPMINAGMVFCDRHFGGINYPVGGVGAIAENMVDGEMQLFAVPLCFDVNQLLSVWLCCFQRMRSQALSARQLPVWWCGRNRREHGGW